MVWTCADEGEWISWTKGGEDGAAGRRKREIQQRVGLKEEDAGMEADESLWRPVKGTSKRKGWNSQKTEATVKISET